MKTFTILKSDSIRKRYELAHTLEIKRVVAHTRPTINLAETLRYIATRFAIAVMFDAKLSAQAGMV